MSDRYLEELREDLYMIRRAATRALERLAALGAGFAPAADVPPVPSESSSSVMDQIRAGLPEDLVSKLTVVYQVDGVVTVTAPWLATDSFDAVTQAVKAMGGRWIKAGKASRWEIPVP